MLVFGDVLIYGSNFADLYNTFFLFSKTLAQSVSLIANSETLGCHDIVSQTMLLH